MKKTTIFIGTLLVAALSHAGLVDWSGGTYNTSIDGLDLQQGWLVALYKDNGNNNTGEWYNSLQLKSDGTVSSSGLLGTSDDDMLVGFTAMLNNAFSTYYNFSTDTLDVEDNIGIYTVMFNSSDAATATQFIVADLTPQNSGSISAPETPINYNVTSFNGGWQMKAIPEPAVASFIAIFGGGMLFARRIFKKV